MIRRTREEMTRSIAALTVALLLGACASTPAPAPAPEPEPQVQPPAQPAQPAVPAPASTAPPQLGDPNPVTLPQVVERRLDNGLRILLVEHHELPIADFMLVVKSGSEEDPARREGLASLTAAMLDEGAGSRSALCRGCSSKRFSRALGAPAALPRRAGDHLSATPSG